MYARALSDYRLDARRCFDAGSFAPAPPPPPDGGDGGGALLDSLLREAQKRGKGAKGARARWPRTTWRTPTPGQGARRDGGHPRPPRGGKLSTARGARRRAQTELGRRLADVQEARGARSLPSTGARIAAENALHGSGHPRVDRTKCAALCASLGSVNETVQHVQGHRLAALNPSDLADLGVAACWLLKSVGSCAPIGWGAQAWARRDTHRRPAGQYQNPLCLSLAPAAPTCASSTLGWRRRRAQRPSAPKPRRGRGARWRPCR